MSRRGRGRGSGPWSRATAAIDLQDVIMVEQDNNNTPQHVGDEGNESAANQVVAVSDEDTELEGVTIGVPAPSYNINDSVLYSYNYFKKVRGEDGKSTFQAKCLVCLVEKKVKTLIKTTDNNTKGLFD